MFRRICQRSDFASKAQFVLISQISNRVNPHWRVWEGFGPDAALLGVSAHWHSNTAGVHGMKAPCVCVCV